MIKLSDPEHFRAVETFGEKSLHLLDESEAILDQFEELQNNESLEKFSSQLGKLLELSQKFELKYIPTLSKLGQKISAGCAQVNDEELLNVVSAVLFDLVDVLKSLMNEIKINHEENINDINLEALKTRFVWISEKLHAYQINSMPAPITYDVDMSELYDIFKLDHSDFGHS
jgi:hypothetical protein